MADDLKISDMVEIGTGDLHDDLAFEVIDPNEALVEDQNKQVKLVTLEASFGAEDKIFEGDSSVEIIDAGTGRIETTADANLIAVQSLNDQKFSIEEGEVGGLHEVFDLDGPNSTIFLGRQVELHLRVGTGSDPVIRAMSGTDDWFNVHTDTQRLGSQAAGDKAYVKATQTGTPAVHIEAEDSTDVSFIDVLGDQILFSILGTQWVTLADDDQIMGLDANESLHVNQSANTIRGYIGGVTEWRLDSAGMKLKGGVTVNDIETTLTDDDTHLPTSGAVVDAISALAPDKIWEGDSYVEVIDTGTGQIKMVVDGSEMANLADDLQRFGETAAHFLAGTGFGPYAKIAFTSLDMLHAEPTFITLGDSGQTFLSISESANTIQADINSVNQFNLASGGMSLNAGATVNDIETTLTDDDTHLPTSGAVVDAIAAAELASLFQSGTAQITAIAGGVEITGASGQKMQITAATGTWDIKTISGAGHMRLAVGNGTQTAIRAYSGGGIWLYYNNVEKMRVGADSLELKDDQSGAEAIGNAATTVAITFGTAHADANYQVLATVENTTDGGPLVLAAIITAKATTGFTATLSAATDSANYVLNWLVVRDY